MVRRLLTLPLRRGAAILTAGVALGLAGCWGDGSAVPSPAVPAGVSIAGVAQKGPYLAGGTVTAYKLDPATGARTGTPLTVATDSNGNFNFIGINWTGPTEIVASGRYYNEDADANSAGTLQLSALADVQTAATVRLNLLTHMLSGRVRTLMAGGQSFVAARKQALGELVNRFDLRLAGDTGPEVLDLTDGVGTHARDNAVLLILSAALLKAGAATQVELDALRDDFADNGRMDGAAFAAIARAGQGVSLATLEARMRGRFTGAAPPGVANLPTPPAWVHGVLPDAGITASQCYQAGSDTLVACGNAGALALSSMQDGMIGRDADSATNHNADGKLGFSYTKLGADGTALAIQTGAYSEAGSEATGTKWSCVRDNLTGLVWEIKTADGGLRDKDKTYTNFDDATQAQKWNNSHNLNPSQAEIDAATNARAYVQAVNTAGLCGANDWRLPTPDELHGLVDYGIATPGPTVDANFFPNTVRNAFWSSLPYVGNVGAAWGVDFIVGDVGYGPRDGAEAVRLVRSSRSATAPFTVSADGQEVTDQATGLIWRRCVEGMAWDGGTCTGISTYFGHENALAHASDQAAAWGKAWRLPSVKELSSIVDRGRQNSAIDSTAFPASPSTWFWTSSPSVGHAGHAWTVNFDNGVVAENYSRLDSLAVRLVRTAQ